MNIGERITKVGSFFLLLGFILSKTKATPFVLVGFSALINGTALVFSFIGYYLTFLASRLYPEIPISHQAWYAFASFKDQYMFSALFGGGTVLFALLALAFPPFAIAACWCLAASNCFSCVAEYNKMHNPPTYEEDYSSQRQAILFRYNIIVTIATVLSSLAVTLVFFLPPTAPIGLFLLTTSTLVGIVLSSWSLYCWVDASFNTHPSDKELSYQRAYNQLAPGIEKKVSVSREKTLENTTLKKSNPPVSPQVSSFSMYNPASLHKKIQENPLSRESASEFPDPQKFNL